MIDETLQHWLDTLRDTATQRWVIGAIGVSAIVAALSFAIIGTDERFGWLAFFAVVTAVVAAVQAGSHTALFTVGLVALVWLSGIDDVTTVRAVFVAFCLYVFHSSLALMAVTPHTAAVHPIVLRRWALRSIVIMAAILGMWLLVTWFEQRDAPADPLLTMLSLGALGATVVAVRHRSGDRSAA